MLRTEGNEFAWFEWDEAKRASNLRKHRIDFQDLIPALTEPHLVKRSSRPEDDAEVRWLSIVRLGERILAVVYTTRKGACRIISARRASRNERKAYYARIGGSAS